MSLSAGQKFGNYEILKPLGRGGMGEVYLAVDRRLKRQVAIKILSSALIERPDQLHRFRQEALFAAVLNHPNICTIYEAGEVNGTTFIAMEHVEGETLRHYLYSHKISVSEIVDYAIQIADALKEAHEKKVIHRDIKTSNIILTPRRAIKILDFGLAKQIAQERNEDFSQASTDFSSGPAASLRGTTPYMSPEAILGKKVDQRSDLFSFGVVLYEMLLRQLPFTGSNNIEVIDAILHKDPLTGTQYQADVPEPLIRVLRKMLEKDPEMRYQSAHEVWIDLRKIREEITRADSIAPTQIQVTKKPSFLKWVIPVLLVALLASMATYYYLTKKTSTIATQNVQLKTVAVLPFDYSGDAEYKYFGTLVTDALIAGLESEPGLSVAPYATVADINSKDQSVQETAKKLGVQWIIQGKVSLKNSNVVIMPQMISAEGKKIYKKDVNASINGIISTLTDVKNALVSELKLSEKPQGKAIEQLRTPKADAYKFYIQARSTYEKWDQGKNLEESISLFRQSLKIDPGSGAAHAGLGMALLTQYGMTLSPTTLVEAKSEAQRAMILDPDIPEVQILEGLVELQSGNSVEAKNAFARALELSPGNDAACRKIAFVYEKSGRYTEAKQMYEQAIALRPSYWTNHYELGTFLYLKMSNFEQARQALLKATELYPEGSAPLIVLGYLNLFMGHLDAAETSFRKVIERGPDIYARNGLGIIYIYQRKYDQAINTFQSLIKELPDQVIYEINLADAFRGMGNGTEAKKHYEIAIKEFRSLLSSNPKDDSSRAGLAMALSATGKCTQAKEEIRSVYTQQKQNIELAGYALITAARCDDLQWAKPIALDAIRTQNLVDILYHPDLVKLREQPEIKRALNSRR